MNQQFASSALNALLPFLHRGKRIFAACIRHWQSSIYSVTASPGTPPAKAYTSSRNIMGIRGLNHCSSIRDLYHKSNKLQKPSCSVSRSSYLIVSCQRTATFHWIRMLHLFSKRCWWATMRVVSGAYAMTCTRGLICHGQSHSLYELEWKTFSLKLTLVVRSWCCTIILSPWTRRYDACLSVYSWL